MSGTVKTLTINGNIVVKNSYNCAIATMVTGNAKFENITVNASLSGGSATGGLFGGGEDGCSIIAVRCINNGNHTGEANVGGLVGYIQSKTAYINGDGTISSTDYLRIKNYFLGNYNIYE